MPSVKKNIIYKILYELINICIPVVTLPYISRVLGADIIGDYSFAYSVIAYFMIFGTLGTSSYGSREISRNRNDKTTISKLFWEIEIVSLFTSSVCLIFWGFVISLSNKYMYYFLCLTPFILSTMLDISWFFDGLEQVKRLIFRDSVIKVLSTVSLFALVNDRADIYKYCLINSVFAVLGSASMWICLPKFVCRVDVKSLHFFIHLKESIVYFIPTIAASIYTILDKTLIGLITKNSYENGYYDQATRILSMIKVFVYSSMNSVLTIRASYLYFEGKYLEAKNNIRDSVDFILLLGIGTMFGIFSVSREFVPWFLGEGYEPVPDLLCIMAPLLVIIGISYSIGSQYYTPIGKRRLSTRFLISGSVINLILNLFLIPVFSAKGATISSLVAEMVITVLYIINCNGYITFSFIFCKTWKRIIAGTIMFFVLYFLQLDFSYHFLELFSEMVIGIIVYILILFVLRDYSLLYFVKKFWKR